MPPASDTDFLFDPQKLPQSAVFIGEPLRTLREGVGVNIFLGRERNCPPTSRADLWEQMLSLLDEARPGFLRIGYLEAGCGPDDVSPWNDEKQRFEPEHDFWNKLRLIDDWCVRHDVNWMLDSWWVPISMQVLRATAVHATGDPRGAPRDPAQYAREYVLPLARQVLQELKLKRCRYLGLLNEPIWGSLARDPDNFAVEEGESQIKVLAEMYRCVREELDAAGMQELGIVGPGHLCSWQMPPLDFLAAGVDPAPHLAAWDMHAYFYRLDWMNDGVPEFSSTQEFLQNTVRRWVDFASQQNKPFLITEMGSFYYGRNFWGERDFEQVGSHTAAITDAQMIVRALQEGVDGFLRWSWCVPAEVDGRWSLVEWEGRDAITPSPNIFPIYKALMNAIPPRSTILKTRVSMADAVLPRLHACGVLTPQGKHRIVLVHDTPGHNADARLYFPELLRGIVLRRTVVDEMRKYVAMSDVCVPDSAAPSVDLMITPYSVTVLEEG
jgi:hypothetical protein